MNISNIDHLLNKYWEGETTVPEEREIKAYFAAGNIDESHRDIAPLFGYFEQEAILSTTKDYGTSLETTAPSKIFHLTKYIRMIAAVCAIAVCAYLGYQVGVDQKQNQTIMASHEVEDPEEALEITKQALAMLSSKLNKQTAKVSKDMNRVSSLDVLR